MNVTVLGAGSWGTTLALVLCKKNNRVTLWGRNSTFIKELKTSRENKTYLPGIKLPETLLFDDNLEHSLEQATCIVIAVPAQSIRETISKIPASLFHDKKIVIVSKGIEIGTGKRMSEVVLDVLQNVSPENVVTFYGPSHAEEVSQDHPTGIVSASISMDSAKYVQQLFHTEMLRVYTSTDIVGVEIAGSIKNIMAIAAGMVEGLGYGDNAKAVLISRGLAEISRFGYYFGANPHTFSGLAGVGDLIVTCLSKHSRNRFVGFEIGKGKKLREVISSMKMVAEGVATTKAIVQISKEKSIDMPISQAVYEVLFEEKELKQAIKELMSRSMREELEW